MIAVTLTHYLLPGDVGYGLNQVLYHAIQGIRETTAAYDVQVRVVYSGGPRTLDVERNLRAYLHPEVLLIRNDRPGRPDIQPSLRNRAVDWAKGDGAEFVVLLHNDIRVSSGWLDALLIDLQEAERKSGRGSCFVSLRLAPYHMEVDFFGSKDRSSDIGSALPRSKILFRHEMIRWAEVHGETMNADGTELVSTARGPALDTGGQVLMGIARPSFFEAVGECDEAFTGLNLDDVDWGMRALLAGQRVLISQSALVGHVGSLTFDHVRRDYNTEIFRAKWGDEVTRWTLSGEIWDKIRSGWKPNQGA